MKKIVSLLSIIIVMFITVSIKQVYADIYKMMELIPHEKTVAIRGDLFLYEK